MSIEHVCTRSVLVGCVLVASTLAALLARRALAGGIPATGTMSYSGTLQDASGALLTGNHNIELKLWSTVSGGADPLCTTGSHAVELQGGRFSVPLPEKCTSMVKANSDTFADVLVDGASLGRTKLGAVPYAVEAGHATNADSATNATHASSADNATNASSATTASEAAGALQSSISTMQSQVAVLQGTALQGMQDFVILRSFDATSYDGCVANGIPQYCSNLAMEYCASQGHKFGLMTGGCGNGTCDGNRVVRCVK
jgi:hypothetical protein